MFGTIGYDGVSESGWKQPHTDNVTNGNVYEPKKGGFVNSLNV